MKTALIAVGLGFAIASMAVAETPKGYEWPDAAPEQLREEIFGIRFYLVLQDRGGKRAADFLRDELKRNPNAPEAMAYAAWTSLYSKSWSMPEIYAPEYCERYLRDAAAAGSSVAKEVLGTAWLAGSQEIGRNPVEGEKLLREAAAAGSPKAWGRLGRMWLNGWCLEKDPEAGAKAIRQAVARGSVEDLAELAEDYEWGRNGAPKDHPKAIEAYYELAAENHPLGWAKLAEYEDKSDAQAKILRAIAMVRLANEGGFIVPSIVKHHLQVLQTDGQDDPRALVELGIARIFGLDWMARDIRGARDCFSRAAAQGNDDAKFFLAYLKMRGFDSPADPAGLAEMHELADLGNVRACARLGFFYYWGATDAGKMQKSPEKAFYYSRKAAALGSKMAALNLAHCYKHAIGTPQNPVLAAKLYAIAMRYGYRNAKEELQRQLAFAKIP